MRKRPGLRLRVAQPHRQPGQDDVAPRRVGDRLREARVQRNEDVGDAARVLRIRESHLRAIEQGDFNALPGPTYASGFVRAYAQHLGLNADEISDQFRQEIADSHRTELNFPVPVMESRIPSAALIFVSMLVAVVVYFGWYFLSSGSRVSIDDVAPAPPELMVGADSERRREAVAPSDDEAAPPPSSVAEDAPAPAASDGPPPAMRPEVAPPPASTMAKPEPVPAEGAKLEAPVAALSPPPKAPPPAVPPAAGGSRITIQARGDSWIQVKDANDNVLMTRVLREGDVYHVPNLAGLRLMTGNAGALDLRVDGTRVPDLGGPGTVLRDVALDPSRLKEGTAVSTPGLPPADSTPPAASSGG